MLSTSSVAEEIWLSLPTIRQSITNRYYGLGAIMDHGIAIRLNLQILSLTRLDGCASIWVVSCWIRLPLFPIRVQHLPSQAAYIRLVMQ